MQNFIFKHNVSSSSHITYSISSYIEFIIYNKCHGNFIFISECILLNKNEYAPNLYIHMIQLIESENIIRISSIDQFTCKRINGILSKYDMYEYIDGAIFMNAPIYPPEHHIRDGYLTIPSSYIRPIYKIDKSINWSYIILYNWKYIRDHAIVTAYKHDELCNDEFHKLWQFDNTNDYMKIGIDVINGHFRCLFKYKHNNIASYYMCSNVTSFDDMRLHCISYSKVEPYLPADNYLRELLG